MLIFLSLVTALMLVLQSIFLKSSRGIGDGGKTTFFRINAAYTGILSIFFLIIFLFIGELQMSAASISIGLIFGLAFTLMMLFYSLAMDTGPLSYTAFYYSVGLVIPVLASIFFWSEHAGILKIIGLLLLLFSFYLINVHGSKGGDISYNRQWMIYCFLAFFFNGTIPVLFKVHQTLLPQQEEIPFMFIGFISALILSLIGAFVFIDKTEKQSAFSGLSIRISIIIIGLAISTGLANLLLTSLSGQLPGIYLFPIVNGSMIVALTVISVLLFKEPISKGGITGIFIGILAIIMFNI